jgi:PilZ domain
MPLFRKRARAERRRLDEPAWIWVEGSFGLQECRVVDMSESGAHLRSSKPIPDVFMLSFSRRERRGKPCKVVWRKGLDVGVAFLA